MRDYRASSDYYGCYHKKSTSKERDRHMARESHRIKERSKRDERHCRDHSSYDSELKRSRTGRSGHDHDSRSSSIRDKRSSRDHDRSGSNDERDYYGNKRYKHNTKKYKHSKKSRHRQLSTSSSSSSLSSLNSQKSYNSQLSEQLHHHRSTIREASLDDKPLCSKKLSKVIPVKEIDLLDGKVQKVLEAIEEDAFIPTTFYKTKDREAPTPQKTPATVDKVIIDLNAETIIFPRNADTSNKLSNNNKSDIIFHPNFFGDTEQKQDKWIRKLYLYRQRYMKQ